MKIGSVFKIWHHKGMKAYLPGCFVHQVCSSCPQNGIGDCSTTSLDVDDLFMILETG
tara:strand:+ start:1617 stop:1787 length:171 start_codon:yes stop_codon:yes gene_type:complete